MNFNDLPGTAKRIHAREREGTRPGLGQRVSCAGIADGTTNVQGVRPDGERGRLLEGHGTRTEVIRLGTCEGEPGVPFLGIGTRIHQRARGRVIKRDTRAKLEEARAESGGMANIDEAEVDRKTARPRTWAAEGERTRPGLGGRKVKGHTATEGQRSSGTSHGPRLDAEGRERSGDHDIAGVGLHFEAVVRASWENRQGATRARSDRDCGDPNRRLAENDAVDGLRGIEGRRQRRPSDEITAED